MSKVLIIYDTGTFNTERMARAIKEGVISENVEVSLKKAGEAQMSDAKEADAIAIGSPNYRDVMMPSVKKFLDGLRGVDLSGKLGLSFGSYGWGLEAIDDIHEIMISYGAEMMEKLGVKGMPEAEELEKCRKAGSLLACRVKG